MSSDESCLSLASGTSGQKSLDGCRQLSACQPTSVNPDS
eukprot:CAMPEP_0198705830 /NCGR_PEP_ID=MMETSP1468-20131203/390640_1 /TAXON_ID=1461545 /ORGANISM="Mantoniella sp, Strain CCMP1436" /LENGTH=38 /DNA_ID= /DNA_START= /DNA_END= /DNA_ORIENTATION=